MRNTSSPLYRSLCCTFLLVALTAGSADWAEAFSCNASKRSVTSRAAVGMLRCQATAVRKGSDPAPCLARLEERVAAIFARAEARGGCSATGNLDAVQNHLEVVTSAILSLLQPQPGNRCVIAKLAASGRRLASFMRCPAGDGDCVDALVERFARAFTRAERRATCTTSGDAGTLGVQIDLAANDLLALVASGDLPVGAAPSNLLAAVAGVQVQLTWMNPDPASGNTEVKVVRRLNNPPSSATDPLATLVFSGAATAASHSITELLPDVPEGDRTYHYAVFGCRPAAFCELVGSRTTLAPTLTQTLRGGGYVLYFRHAIALQCTDQVGLGMASTTMSPDWWKSCESDCNVATARQLTLPNALTETAAIRDYFDATAVPVGRVLSSEFCRCKTTAELLELGPAVETSPLITFFVYDDVQDRCANSRTLTRTPPDPGTNTAIVTHVGITCDDLGTLLNAEAIIFKPDGQGGATQVTRVEPQEWAFLP